MVDRRQRLTLRADGRLARLLAARDRLRSRSHRRRTTARCAFSSGCSAARHADRFATLETLVRETEQHRAAVGRSLQTGVEDALTRLVSGFARGTRRRPVVLDAALADALTIVYRILFLLFAEARGLVPQWHPVYRDSYTIESLRPVAEGDGRAGRASGRRCRRLRGSPTAAARAGTLRVVPFNGRLFAPSAAPLAETLVPRRSRRPRRAAGRHDAARRATGASGSPTRTSASSSSARSTSESSTTRRPPPAAPSRWCPPAGARTPGRSTRRDR